MGYRTPFRFAQQSSGSSLPIVIEICKQNNWSINTKICKQKSGRVTRGAWGMELGDRRTEKGTGKGRRGTEKRRLFIHIREFLF